jgi:hypothetical protein
LNTLAQITERNVVFKFLSDAWSDTTTAHWTLMLFILGELAVIGRSYNDSPQPIARLLP